MRKNKKRIMAFVLALTLLVTSIGINNFYATNSTQTNPDSEQEQMVEAESAQKEEESSGSSPEEPPPSEESSQQPQEPQEPQDSSSQESQGTQESQESSNESTESSSDNQENSETSEETSGSETTISGTEETETTETIETETTENTEEEKILISSLEGFEETTMYDSEKETYSFPTHIKAMVNNEENIDLEITWDNDDFLETDEAQYVYQPVLPDTYETGVKIPSLVINITKDLNLQDVMACFEWLESQGIPVSQGEAYKILDKPESWLETLSPNQREYAEQVRASAEPFYQAAQGLSETHYLDCGYSTPEEDIFEFLLENTEIELSSYFSGTIFSKLTRENLQSMKDYNWAFSDLQDFYYIMTGANVVNDEIRAVTKVWLKLDKEKEEFSETELKVMALGKAYDSIKPVEKNFFFRSAPSSKNQSSKLTPLVNIGSVVVWSININGVPVYCMDHGLKARTGVSYDEIGNGTGQVGYLANMGEPDWASTIAMWYILEQGGSARIDDVVAFCTNYMVHAFKFPAGASNATFLAQSQAVADYVNASYGKSGGYKIFSCGKAGYQRFLASDGIPDAPEPNDKEIVIPEPEFGTLNMTGETSYTVEVYKDSVITNEKLYDIYFDVKENLVSANGSGDACGHCSATIVTDKNGYASKTFDHSASWSEDYVSIPEDEMSELWDEILDEVSELNPLTDFPITDQFGESYATMADVQKKADEEIDSVSGIKSVVEASEALERKLNAFLGITYSYTLTEQARYTHELSGEGLPKFGYRKNVSGVTTSDVQTSAAVANGNTKILNFTNEPWYNEVYVNKADLESTNQILYDAAFDIYENTSSSTSPSWGNRNVNYECVRIVGDVASSMGISEGDDAYGMYTVHRKAASDAYTGTTFSNYKEYGTLYFTQVNQGKFAIIERTTPHNGELNGYINDLLTRPYTKLNGNTDKEFPVPTSVEDDIASKRNIHYLNLCKDTNQYKKTMMVDGYTDYSDSYYTNTDEAEKSHEYDSESITEIETTLSGTDYIQYNGKFDSVLLNYNTYANDAKMLNKRAGHNGSHFIEVDAPVQDREHAFFNERQYGFIRLTKFDIEAGRYVDGSLTDDYRDGTHHGDADLDGAIYSIYVDGNENGGILHPDGNEDGAKHDGEYAVMEEQQIFVDSDGDGYSDKWVTQDSTLANGNKIASAMIVNGELEFDGLYLGNYFICEEVRAVTDVYSHTNDGSENKEVRKLSFAPGYYVEVDENNEPIKHYYSFTWDSETGSVETNSLAESADVEQTYVHKNTTEVTNQQVIKGGIQLAKISQDETIGSGSTNVEALQGAGFSIFLVSELSKVVDGTIRPAYSIAQGHAMIADGSMVRRFDSAKQFVGYQLTDATGLPNPNANSIIFVPKYGYFFEADILAAYINQHYSNVADKWDFTGETQALARAYEDNVSEIEAQNAKYQHVPNHKGPNGTDTEWYGQDGIGDGYLTYDNFVNKYAYARTNVTDVKTSREYVLSELKTNIDGYIRTPLLPWGAYLMVETTVPRDKFAVDPMFIAITDSSPTIDRTEKYYQVDASLVENLHLVKRDAQTGQIVRAEGVKFRIWDYTDNRYITVTGQTSTGYVEQISVFETGKDGIVLFPGLSTLEVGKYRIEEIQGPEGFWNAYWDYGNPDTNPKFPNEDLGGQGTDKDNSTGTNMKQKYFGTVEFEVTTERLYQSSSIVTDNNLDCLYIGEYYSNSETLGKLTIMKTGEVLVGYENTDNIQYTDDEEFNQNKSYKTRAEKEELEKKYDIGTDTIVTDDGEGAAYTDSTEEAFYNYDDNTYDFVYEERPLADATYQIIAAEDIYTQDNQTNEDGSRTTWFKKGDIVGTITTGNAGEIVDFVPYYNQGGTYDYTLTKSGFTGTKSYTAAQFASTGVIENKWTEAKMSELYKAIFGVPAFQDEYILPNSYVNPQGERQCIVRVLKDGTLGEVSILLPLGSYTVKEIEAPYGFVSTTKEIDVTFTWEDQIKEVVFNTKEDSVADTQSNIDRFVGKNLAWWLGGVNTLNEAVKTRIGTYTDDFLGDGEDVFWVDQNGFVHFYNDRILIETKPDTPDFQKGIGVYKYDRETSVNDYTASNEYVLTAEDLADGLHPEYSVGEKVYKINDELLWLKGAKFALHADSDIYNVDGKKVVSKDQLLAVATTDGLGFASFNVDVPYESLHSQKTPENDELVLNKGVTFEGDSYETTVSIDGNTAANDGKYYIVELTPPEGYLLNENPSKVQFTYKDQDTPYIAVYGEVDNLKTITEISKRDITNEDEIAGATLEVWWVKHLVRAENGLVDQEKSKLVKVDEWVSDGSTHVIRGLRYSNLEVPRLDNDAQKENVYILKETNPTEGYVTAKDIEFEIVQDYEVAEDGSIQWLQTNTLWVNNETTVTYADGVVKAQQQFTDHDGEYAYNYNHDENYFTNDKPNTGVLTADGCEVTETVDSEIVANWTLVNGILIIDVEESATDESVKKSLTSGIMVEALEQAGYSPEEVEFIYFLTSELDAGFMVGGDRVTDGLFESYIVKTRVDVEAPSEEEPIDPEFAATEPYQVEMKESPFTKEMVIMDLPIEVVSLMDKDLLNADNPSVYIIPTYEWMSVLNAYSEAADNKTLSTDHAQHVGGQTKENYTLVMHDERTKLWIAKRDITTGETVIGATLTIKNLDGTVALDRDGNEMTWVTDGKDHYIELLPIGEYILEETQAPTKDGYVFTASVKFEIEDDGHINTVYMPDNYTRVEITKTDIVSGEEIKGAHLEVWDENGMFWDEWVSDGTPHYIERLPDGKYYLKETLAPMEDGYTTSNTVEFIVSDKDVVTRVEMKDDFTVVEISKVDITTLEEIAGAELEIYRYITIEETEVIENPDGTTTENTVEKEVLSEEPLYAWTSGYTYDENGNVVTGEDGKPVIAVDEEGNILPHVITHVPVGKYLLVEKTAPEGYLMSESIEFEVTDKLYHYAEDKETILRDEDGNILVNNDEKVFVQMKDDYTKVDVSKVDITSKDEIIGAEMEIYKAENVKVNEDGTYETTGEAEYSWISGYVYDEEGNIVKNEDGSLKEAVDENGKVIPHRIERIPVGDYVLIEKTAPDGYMVAENVAFTVEATGDIQKVVMEDERGIFISKQNMANSAEVNGAKLSISEAILVDKETMPPETTEVFILNKDTDTFHFGTCEQAGVVDNKAVVKIEGTISSLSKKHTFCEECKNTIQPIIKKEYEASDVVVEEWTSGKAPHGVAISLLEEGKVYALVETQAPDGYFKADTIFFKFEYNEDRSVTVYSADKNGIFEKVNENVVVMKDDHTTVDIHKVDEKGNLLAGARLAIETLLGKRIVEFTTGSSYTQVIGLPVGTYRLVEISAPDGYEIARPITFKVTEENRYNNPVTLKMVDSKIHVKDHDSDDDDNDKPKESTTTETTEVPETVTPETPSEVVVVPPQTDDSNYLLLFATGAGISIMLIALIWAISKRKKKNP